MLSPTCRKYMALSWWRRNGSDISSLAPASSGRGVGNGVEVLHRRQWDGHVCHAADLGRPDAGRGDNEVCADVAVGGMHGGDAPVGDSRSRSL